MPTDLESALRGLLIIQMIIAPFVGLMLTVEITLHRAVSALPAESEV